MPSWQDATVEKMRRLILAADPAIVEEIKWRKPSNPDGVPVFSREGILCTLETYKASVKLTFAEGAALDDPKKLFNASLDAGTRRAIDIREGELPNAAAFKALVKSAVAHNVKKKSGGKKAAAKKKAAPRLLSGDNPQIAKADGDAPVQEYIAAIPGWKRATTAQIDALIVRTVPGVKKAVKWNSPLYGVDGQGWFASIHMFTNYVKITFFMGAKLKPLPPGGTAKSGDARWLDVPKEGFDEKQLAAWVEQAAALPGWKT